jgi:hypothetical protein
MSGVIQFSAPVAIEAAASKGPRRFSAVAYNGGELRVKGYKLPVVIDLDGLGTRNTVTANLDHDQQKRVGHVDDVRNDHRALGLGGLVSATGSAAEEFTANHDRGYPWQASVEVSPEQIEEIPAGKTARANGRTFAGPIYIARKSILSGVAFLPQGADDGTRVSIAATHQKGNTMEPEFHDWIISAGFSEPATLTTQQTSVLRKQFEADATRGNPVSIIRGEAARVKAIDAISLEAAKAISETVLAKCESIKASGIANGTDPVRVEAQVELEILRASRPQGPSIHSGTNHMNIDNAKIIEAALAINAGLPGIEDHYDERVLDAATKPQMRGMGVQRLLIMAAIDNGYHWAAGERITAGNLRNVLAYALPPIHAASSTMSVSGLLSNVANKELLTGWMEMGDEWREISTTKPVNDFKQHTSYRMLDNAEYEQLGPNGEIKHGTLGEESYTRQAKTYAKMLALTREQIINDDLGAFDDLRTRIGRGAAKKFRKVFWAAFMDNANFFTSARGNYIEGSTTNLGTDYVGLQAGLTAFRDLRTAAADGAKKIGGQPALLLVPPELETNAVRLYSPIQAAEVANVNPYAGKYRPVVVDELSDSSFTGNSATAWYLLRAANQGPAMVVSFLNGQQAPTVETADADFDQLGVQFRGYHDFGCDQAEYLAGIKSKGAA